MAKATKGASAPTTYPADLVEVLKSNPHIERAYINKDGIWWLVRQPKTVEVLREDILAAEETETTE